MEEFFQNYGEKIGFIIMEILGGIWVYFRTKKKLTPEEKQAKQLAKQGKKAEKSYQKAKADADKYDAMKAQGGTNA